MQRIIFIILLLLSSQIINAQKAGSTLPDSVVTKSSVNDYFLVSEIDDATFKRMQKGGSYPKGCSVKRSDLRYLKVLHRNFNGEIQVGELVCNRTIAHDMLDIFRELFDAGYQIERMMLIDEYGADDEASMRANNTSCFCYRVIKGSTKLSKHSQGLAIDINPLQNPCVKYRDGHFRSIQPDTNEARKYVKRNNQKHIITTNDLCYRLFRQHGFIWGGAWKNTKDYQHFEVARILDN